MKQNIFNEIKIWDKKAKTHCAKVFSYLSLSKIKKSQDDAKIMEK